MLERLRAKPDHIKRNVSFVATIIVFCGIVFVWLSSLDARKQSEEARASALSPFAGLTEVLSGVSGSIKGDTGGSASGEIPNTTATTSLSSNFDISGIVVIDTTKSTTTSMIASSSQR